MDIDGVADELYGLTPDRFIATRSDREREAKAAGDRALAARIHQLAKPTTVAWLANSMVRARRAEIEPLLELGAGLRAASATLDGELLRELDRQQHRIVQALVRHARRLAADAGRPVSEDTARGLESILHAALADQTAADALAGGRLTDALHRDSGFPDAEGAPHLTSVPTGRSARTDAALRTSIAQGRSTKAARIDREAAEAAARQAEQERAAAELELARRAEQRAQLAARVASEARERAVVVAGRARQATRKATAAVELLRADLESATTEQTRLADVEAVSEASLAHATAAERDANRLLEDATRRRHQLSTPKP